MEQIQWESVLSGNLPDLDDVPQRGYVDRSSKKNCESGILIFQGLTQWTSDQETLQIEQDVASNRRGVRPYFPDVMEAVPSHQDFQPTHGEAFLRNYFTKYSSKFSDSMVEGNLVGNQRPHEVLSI